MKKMLTLLLDPMKNIREQFEKEQNERKVQQFKKNRLLTRKKK